ncbi:MAG: hypothetical protein EZS28_039165 [Streblomastix strix]|uniref:Rhodanese domain-containing protein n=1 Tax=Streblomastix strix TaxID=222440 RepID=A0A5J4U4R0_9EUKA|nr:MAG: hypothetical protein EZS28_039165 [Streblomastix strix]
MANCLWIEPEQLADWMKNSPNETIIIDVRDIDYQVRKIPGSKHIEYSEFPSQIEQLISDLQKLRPKPKRIVFHCMFCKQRGPSAAEYFYQKSQDASPNLNLDVCILNGGFNKWKIRFFKDENMFETIP